MIIFIFYINSINMATNLGIFFVVFILFLIIANSMTYKTTDYVLGNWVVSADDKPTTGGLILHALVMATVTLIVLNLF